MDEWLCISTRLASPVRDRRRVSRSADVVGFSRNRVNRVESSIRCAPGNVPGDVASTLRDVELVADDLLDLAIARFGDLALGRLQSVVVRAFHRGGPLGTVHRATAFARLDTPVGPVVRSLVTPTFGMHPLPGADANDTMAGPSEGPFIVSPPPTDLRDRPLRLRPPVAAIVLYGAWLALTSRSSGEVRSKLVGRRMLPGLTLTDEPSIHPLGGRDDAGERSVAFTLIEEGRLCELAESHSVNSLAGRAVWDHDTQCLRSASEPIVVTTGPPSTPTLGAVDLVWCLEGLQRYYIGGLLRLRCLARTDDGAPWFVCELRAKPLVLLRAVQGTTGYAVVEVADGLVVTPTLVLSGVSELKEKGHGQLAV